MDTYFGFSGGLPGKGAIPAEYMIVGMAPSTRRPAHRKLEPFGASAHRLVSQLMQDFPGQIYLTNLVKAPVPPKKKLGIRRIRFWYPCLVAEVQVVKPKRILVLGNEGAKFLCPGFEGLAQNHGLFFQRPDLPCWIVPTYHFAAIQRDPGYKTKLVSDLKRFFTLPDPEYGTYQLLESPEQMELPRGAELYCDIETKGLQYGCGILQIGMRAREATSEQVWILHAPTDEQVAELGAYLRERQVKALIGHNFSFDLRVLLARVGKRFPRIPCQDTMLMAHVLGEKGLSLKHLLSTHTDLSGRGGVNRFADPIYLTEDIRATTLIDQRFREKAESVFFYRELLAPLAPVAAGMTARGVHMNYTDLAALREEAQQRLEETRNTLTRCVPGTVREINWNSTKQVREQLVKAGVPLKKRTPTGLLATGEPAIAPFRDRHPIVDALLQYRGAEKLQSGFVEGYMARLSAAHPYLHPTWRLTGTRTGRLSCAGPNLQQVPKVGKLKLSFTSRHPGGWISLVDLAQAELRIAALLSNDQVLLQALLSTDPHRYIAALLIGCPEAEVTAEQRKFYKRVTFGLLYGGSVQGIAAKGGVPEERIAEVVLKFFSHMTDLQKFFRLQRTQALELKELRTPFGLIRDLREELLVEGQRAIFRKAINTPIQGTAGGLNHWILVHAERLLREYHLRTRPILTVHDSCIFDGYPGEEARFGALIQEVFYSFRETPLVDYAMYKELPFTGELKFGESWANVEDTSPYHNPTSTVMVSSL